MMNCAEAVPDPALPGPVAAGPRALAVHFATWPKRWPRNHRRKCWRARRFSVWAKQGVTARRPQAVAAVTSRRCFAPSLAGCPPPLIGSIVAT